MPDAMTKNELKKTRNRDDASARLEFTIMEGVKDHSFYPKPQEIVKPFAQRRAAYKSRDSEDVVATAHFLLRPRKQNGMESP